jgi:hypothetical protein
MPWFVRVQSARIRAGEPPGVPLEEFNDPARREAVRADCARFGITAPD